MKIEDHRMFGKVITDSKGRIAYHSYLFREDSGLDFVQYDFDGKELYRQTVRTKPVAQIYSNNP